jgi:AcrR family transcriptional regulator
MTELEKGPQGRRRGRGARERILGASQQLFRDQGINGTGMDQLCAAAQVSKRTAYQHFTGKDELVAEYLLQGSLRRAARRNRPRSRRHQPRTARRATGAAP